MPSILTTPPATEPVSLAEAKAYLRVGHADEDAFIGTLIIAARRQAEARTGLVFITQGWSHFRDGWPDDGVIDLPLAPVITVDSVSSYGDDDAETVVDPDNYFVDRVSRPARILLRGSTVWARPGRIGNGIEVALTAGFGTAAAVPEPLRQAMLQLVAHGFANRGDEQLGIPVDVAALLQQFRGMRL